MTKDSARAKAELRIIWANGAEKKANILYQQLQKDYKDFDWTEPIKIGHHSERRHRAMRDQFDAKMGAILALEKKAKTHRSKAEHLRAFADRNKGDAERVRAEKREILLRTITVGSKVTCPLYNGTIFEVRKINKKTARIRSGLWETTTNIHFLDSYDQHATR